MPTYTTADITRSGRAYLGGSGGPHASLLGWIPGVLAVTTATRTSIDWYPTPTFSFNTTAEKTNTRSPAAANLPSYSTETLSGSPVHTVIIFGQSQFNNSCWFAQPRYFPTIFDADGIEFQGIVGAGGVVTAIFDENVYARTWVRGRMRRTRKPGYFNVLGTNGINKVTVGGGGAFNAIYPVFQVDLTYVDQSAWRNGMHQSNVWNINLFGVATSTGTLNSTLDDATVSSTATVKVTGTDTSTLADVTSSSTATVKVTGTDTSTLADVTSSSTATVKVTGTDTNTLDAVTVGSTATVKVTGTDSSTLDATTVSSTATVKVTGTDTSTLGDATTSSAGTVSITGADSTTLGDVASSCSGTVSVSGSGSNTFEDCIAGSATAVLVQAMLTQMIFDATLSATGIVFTPSGGTGTTWGMHANTQIQSQRQ